MEGIQSAIPLRWEWGSKKDKPVGRRKMPFSHLHSMFTFLHGGLLDQRLYCDCTFPQQFRVFREPFHAVSHLEFTGRNSQSGYRGKASFHSSIFQKWDQRVGDAKGFVCSHAACTCKAKARSQGEWGPHDTPQGCVWLSSLITQQGASLRTPLLCYWKCLSYQLKSVVYLHILSWHLLFIIRLVCLYAFSCTLSLGCKACLLCANAFTQGG